MAGISYNLGYASAGNVTETLSKWYEIFRLHQPTAVLSDFGIASSILATVLHIPHLRIGAGYECPMPGSALPRLPGEPAIGQSRLRVEQRIENDLMSWIETAVAAWGGRTDRGDFNQFVTPRNRCLLTTVRPLDPYADFCRTANQSSRDGLYLGGWDEESGRPIEWGRSFHLQPPNVGVPMDRVFAYLLPRPSTGRMLDQLSKRRYKIATVVPGVGPVRLRRIADGVIPQNDRVLLRDVGRQCCFAVTNANHGTTLRLLLSGVPVLVCPTNLEQRHNADRIVRYGLGHRVFPDQRDYTDQIDAMACPELLNRVQVFARDHRRCDGGESLEKAAAMVTQNLL